MVGTPALLLIATLVRVNSNLIQIPQWLQYTLCIGLAWFVDHFFCANHV